MNGMPDRVEVNPAIHHGNPVIRGTRVPVARIVGAVAGGDPIAQVADDYGIAIDDVKAALMFAASLVEREQFHPLPKSA
jgi:uncharacterized protein (DUF433 family)